VKVYTYYVLKQGSFDPVSVRSAKRQERKSCVFRINETGEQFSFCPQTHYHHKYIPAVKSAYLLIISSHLTFAKTFGLSSDGQTFLGGGQRKKKKILGGPI
jgi:hypothetical protein